MGAYKPLRILRAGVVGAGYFGSRHAYRYDELPNVAVSAVCDIRADSARELAKKIGATWAKDYRDLVGLVDCVSVVTPVESHFEITQFFLQQGIHVLVEKPICETVEQADKIIQLAERNGLVLSVGHVERFNPTVHALFRQLNNPQFIMARRLSPPRNNGTPNNVILDLMIHDLDLVVQAVNEPVRRIEVKPYNLPHHGGNQVQAHLAFERGCTALLVAGYRSSGTERTFCVFQSGLTMDADLSRGTLSLRISSQRSGADLPNSARTVTQRYETFGSLLAQLNEFVRSIEEKSYCLKSANMARQALQLAVAISSVIVSDEERFEIHL